MAYDEKAAERIRWTLGESADFTEQKMMGGLVFMVSGHMCCGVTGEALMVRIGPEAAKTALKETHVGPFDIGGGRRPKAFICVEPAGFRSEKALAGWVRRGLDFVGSLPQK